MATIREVAKLAGVSPITVSRVVNNTSYVSVETRARVEAAIDELNYVPNKLAQSLRQKQTNTLALLLTDITNPFWTTVARGVEDVASEHGLNVILCNTDESESKQNTYLNLVLQKQVDGILLVPVNDQCEAVQKIQAQNVPVVVMDRKVTNAQVDVVRGDSEGGAYQLVHHLLEQGHRRIALLNGAANVSTALGRANGYRRALAEAPLGDDCAEQICYGEFTLASGHEMTKQVLSGKPRPTALFAANNFIAIGALRVLREAGLRVPEDMAVVAFDDLPEEIVIEPFLTVSAQPAYQMGRKAMELLLARITGESSKEFQEIILPTELIIRASSDLRLGERS